MRVLFYARGEEHLGIELLSAVLRREGHTTGLVLDPGFEDVFFLRSPDDGARRTERLVDQALAFRPDLVALSTMTLGYRAARAFARRLRARARILTVAGGPHASARPEAVLEHEGIDLVAVGEAEHTLAVLVERLGTERAYDTPGLCHRQGGRFHRNPPAPAVTDLDSLPIPDKALFERRGAIRSRLTAIGSRGCRHACAFCSHSFQRDLFRATGAPGPYARVKTPGAYLDELAALQRGLRPRSVRFWDETFGYDLAWLEEFTLGYRRRVGLPFACTMHADSISERSAALLAAAGCRNVAIGVESGSERVRREVHGRNTSDDCLIEAARLVRGHGMRLLTENIVCAPGEGPEDMERTLGLNLAMAPWNAAAFVFFPFPGTRLWRRCRDDGSLRPEVAAQIEAGSARYNSWHKRSALDHPHAEVGWRTKLLLPLLVAAPRHEALLRRLASDPRWERALFAASLVHTDRTEFVQKLADYARIARGWRGPC